ncbi:MAG: hypothetical protein OEL89_00740 [Candidatus Peregrinibacteria bacterium]|nr:hypothetical protein [Candidatus Peregrinibacteria bacterium]
MNKKKEKKDSKKYWSIGVDLQYKRPIKQTAFEEDKTVGELTEELFDKKLQLKGGERKK